MIPIENVAHRSIALLAAQFQELPDDLQPTRFQSLIIALCFSAQDLQNYIQQMITQRWLSNAIGAHLDGIGQILGLARIPGQSDESYREALTFQIRLNYGSGTPEQVIDAALFFSKGTKVWYIDAFPAAYELITNGLTFPTNPSDLATAIQTISPAGVNFLGLILTYNTVPFSFSGDEGYNPFYVAPDPSDTTLADQLEMNTGDFLYVTRGIETIPDFGGWFEELTTPPDDFGAGQFTELLPP